MINTDEQLRILGKPPYAFKTIPLQLFGFACLVSVAWAWELWSITESNSKVRHHKLLSISLLESLDGDDLGAINIIVLGLAIVVDVFRL